MRRLTIIAAFAAALVLGLGACSSSPKSGGTTTTTKASTTTTMMSTSQTTQMGGMDAGSTMAPGATMP